MVSEYMKNIFMLLRMEPQDTSSVYNITLNCQEEELQWTYSALTFDQIRICLDHKSFPRKSGFTLRT